MSNKNSRIILEDNRNDFSFKKNKSNINESNIQRKTSAPKIQR